MPSSCLTQAWASARGSARVLPDQSRETSTRRPPMPRVVFWWTRALQCPGEPAVGLLRLDAVEQPVGAPLGTGRDPQPVPEPGEVIPLRIGRMVWQSAA